VKGDQWHAAGQCSMPVAVFTVYVTDLFDGTVNVKLYADDIKIYILKL